MKKSLKILTLVLSVALIFGALAVAAFADSTVTGVKQVKPQNFEEYSAEEYGYGTDSKYNNVSTAVKFGNGVWFCYTDGRLGYSALRTSEYDENNYIYWRVDNGGVAPTKTNPAYFEITVGSDPSLSNGAVKVDSINNYNYFVADFDIYTPTGIIPHKMNAEFLAKYYNSAGTRTFHDVYSKVNFDMQDGKIRAYFESGSNKNDYVFLDSTTSWNHITFIIGLDHTGGQTVYTFYLYVNGKYATSTTNIKSAFSADQYYNSDPTGVGMTHLRFNYPAKINSGNTCGEGEFETVALDNIVPTTVSASSNTNLGEVLAARADITNWDSNVYDESNVPFGTPVVNNITQNKSYDSLAKAIKAANDNDQLVLLGDVASLVYVDKAIEIDSKGFVCNVEGVNPYMLVKVGDVYYFEESSEDVDVIWGACNHIEGCTDETHPGGVESTVLLNGNIWNTYTKDHKWTYADVENGKLYILDGWMNAETGELINENTVVDEELLEAGLLELEPVILVKSYAYEYTNSSGNVVKEYDSATLGDIIADAKDGTVIKLLSDIAVTANVRVSKDITLDLDGHTITSIQPNGVSKYHLFTVTKKFTLTTSSEGAKIFHGKERNTISNANLPYQGDAIIFVEGKNHVVTIDGSKGLKTYSAVLYMVYGNNPGELYINGGEYYTPKEISDSHAFLNIDTIAYAELKNALFWSDSCTLGFLGGCFKESTLPTEASKVNVDNCVFLGGNIANYDNKWVEVTFTNCFLTGKISIADKGPTRSGCLAPELGGTWILGEGNYIADYTKISDKVIIADGAVKTPVSISKTFATYLNKFTAGDAEASKVITAGEESYTFTTYIGKPVKITWYDTDGTTVLGVTEDALTGMTATPPTTPVAAVNGWLNATYSQWTDPNGKETTVVPTGVSEYSFTLVEGSDTTYVAGKVPVYINYTLVLHFQLNIYVPANAPEGISNVAVKYNKDAVTPSGTYTINGEEYKSAARWPNAAKADDDFNVFVTFTYDGQTYTYTSPSFNIGDYAQAIFDGEYSTAMKQATLSTLKYVEAANNVMGYSLSAELSSAIANAPVSIVIDDVDAGEAVAIPDDFKQYVSSTQLVYSDKNGGIQFRFYKTQKSIDENATVNVLYKDGYSSSRAADDSSAGNYPQTENKADIAFWYTHSVKSYDFDNDLTIQVKVGGQVVAECQYSLAEYAAGVKNDCTTEQWNLILATLAFAKYTDAIKLTK